jgi:hypothetical protein
MNHLREGFIYTPNPDGPFVGTVNSALHLLDNVPRLNPLRVTIHNYTVIGDPERAEELHQYIEDTLVAQLRKQKYDLKFTPGIETEEELFDYVKGSKYMKDDKHDAFVFAIQAPPKGYNNFTIYQSANFPDLVPETRFFEITPKPNFDNYNKYSMNGFVMLQMLLSNFVLKQAESKGTIEGYATVGQTKAFTKDDFMDNIGPTLALFILLIFIAPQYRFISFITLGKKS